MPTKLSRYAEGVMEAAWLAAVIVVPIFFNVYSSRIFEPDKITLLRTLALVILAAWLVKLIEQGGARWDQIPRPDNGFRGYASKPGAYPFDWPGFGADGCLHPGDDLFGHTLHQSVGLVPAVARHLYDPFLPGGLFRRWLANLRQREQVDRLVGAMILSSLPVSLYGVLQRYGADPIPWGGDVSARIAANMGNSIFIAAYLIMVFPLTLMRVVDAFEALLTDRLATRTGSANSQEQTQPPLISSGRPVMSSSWRFKRLRSISAAAAVPGSVGAPAWC